MARRHNPAQEGLLHELEPPISAYSPLFDGAPSLLDWRTPASEAVFADEEIGLALIHRLQARACAPPVYIVTPDRIQAILPTRNLSGMEALLRGFEEVLADMRGSPSPILLWGTQRLSRRLTSPAALAEAVDRLHYAPVALGLVSRPEEWRLSSYGAWIEGRIYRLGWGWRRPPRLRKNQ